ncbi:hypothetical protein MASR2M44_23740 [Bacteroidota bacterium]
MRNALLVLFLLIQGSAFAQDYHWDFAMSTGTCRLQPGALYENLAIPFELESDNAGNVYVLGNFPTANFDKQFRITPELSVFARSGSQQNQLYLYKVNPTNQVEWGMCIEAENNSLEKISSSLALSVNPYSGKVYLIMEPYSTLHINGNPIYPQLSSDTRKLMLCFESDGSFNKIIYSKGILSKPIFSSSETGVFKASRFDLARPDFDSVSFFLFDARKDSILFHAFSNYDNLMYFDPEKQVYISEFLGEYDSHLIRIKGSVYQHSHNFFSYTKIQHKKDKAGNHYFHYKNNVNPGNPATYMLFKLNAAFQEQWRTQNASGFQMDTSGNLWLFKHGDFNPTKDNTRLNPADVMLVQLNPETGQENGTRIVPTNLIGQSWVPDEALELFKITSANDFWISGNLINEAEFGNNKITGNCSNASIPYQHYLAKAQSGWSQDRKNLSLSKIEKKQEINLYPNPASTYIQLPGNLHSEIMSIEVFNLQGQFVSRYSEQAHKLDISNLNQGFYVLRIKTDKGIYCARFMKQ